MWIICQCKCECVLRNIKMYVGHCWVHNPSHWVNNIVAPLLLPTLYSVLPKPKELQQYRPSTFIRIQFTNPSNFCLPTNHQPTSYMCSALYLGKKRAHTQKLISLVMSMQWLMSCSLGCVFFVCVHLFHYTSNKWEY